MKEINLDNIDLTNVKEEVATSDLLQDKIDMAYKNNNQNITEVQKKVTNLLSIEENLINRILPKIKSVFNGIGEKVNLFEEETFLLKEKNINDLFKKRDKLIQPKITSGGFKAFIIALGLSLSAGGMAILYAAKELGIQIEQSKLIEYENGKAIISYIGEKSSIANLLGIDTTVDNYFSGLGVLSGSILLTFLLVFITVKLTHKIKSKNKLSSYQDEAREQLSDIKLEGITLGVTNKYLDINKNLLLAVTVLLEEKSYQLERVIFFEKINMTNKSIASRKIGSIKLISEKLIELITVELIVDEKINDEYIAKSNELKSLINQDIENIYGDKKLFI